MRAISYLLPHSYIFESMRSILRGQPASIPSLLIGASMAVLYVLLACWFFKKTFQRAVRTGLIARYSAETVN
jgi:ABC-2 type transport system permease protein